MNEVFKTFLSLSISGSLLILILSALKHFLKDKVSRQWQYYIWLIVIARLLLPLAPQESLMGNAFLRINQVTGRFETLKQSPQEPPAPIHAENRPALGEAEGNGNIQTEGELKNGLPLLEMVTLLKNNIWLVWLFIALILLIRKITVYQGFTRYVKAGQIPVSDIEMLDQAAIVGEQAGIKKPIELCVNPLISSPLLIGFFRLCIVLPSKKLPEKNFQYIVLHELTHYRRGDMLYKWLVQLTICLHWFNPLVYVMGREINKACEFSCDEAIIEKLDSANAREYGRTLLEAMAAVGVYKEALGAVTLNENKELLKERLGAIMNYKKKNKSSVITTALFTAVLSIGAMYTGAYAGDVNYEAESRMVQHSETKEADIIDTAHIDEMALALTDKIWVWDWVAFFVPYMSEEGVSQIIPTSENSQWAGSLDYTTMLPIQFTQEQVDNARKVKTEKSCLTKADIDSHAEMIMQNTGNWGCIDFMLPYMTADGVNRVTLLYAQKHGGQMPVKTGRYNTKPASEYKAPASGSSADAQALDIMQRTGNWGYIEPYLPQMTNSGIDAVVNCYNSKHMNKNEHKKASDYYH